MMALDGEISARDAARIDEHLKSCWTCRSRKLELERAISDFVRIYEDAPPAGAPEGPRALLRARLERIAEEKHGGWIPDFHPAGLIAAGATCALVLIAGVVLFSNRNSAARPVVVPNPNITPGAAILAKSSDLCREVEPNNKDVPVALKRQVFAEYGLAHVETRAYEVDYLITPALGGADDIHNLWPHSNTNTEWNAKVKDALENQLRAMVCDGQLDLATAQRELATNWIDAYKKYFHTDRPISVAQ